MDGVSRASRAARGWAAEHAAELRLGVRTTAAGLLAWALARLLDLAEGYWAVITAVIVMQGTVGGSLKAALDRFLGTLAGAAWGGIVTACVPHTGGVGLGFAVAAALAPLALLSALKPSFRIAPVTAVIVLLVAGHSPHPLSAAAERVLEIALGDVVGLGVALLVLPARALGAVTAAAADVLGRFAVLLPALLKGATAARDEAAVRAAQDAARAALERTGTATEEAARERRSRLAFGPDPAPLLRTLHRLRHDLVILGRAAVEPVPPPVRDRLGPPLDRLAEAAPALFRGVGEALVSRRPPPDLTAVEAATAACLTAIEAAVRDPAARDVSGGDAARLSVLGFALEQMRLDLRDLARRTAELAGADGAAPG